MSTIALRRISITKLAGVSIEPAEDGDDLWPYLKLCSILSSVESSPLNSDDVEKYQSQCVSNQQSARWNSRTRSLTIVGGAVFCFVVVIALITASGLIDRSFWGGSVLLSLAFSGVILFFCFCARFCFYDLAYWRVDSLAGNMLSTDAARLAVLVKKEWPEAELRVETLEQIFTGPKEYFLAVLYKSHSRKWCWYLAHWSSESVNVE